MAEVITHSLQGVLHRCQGLLIDGAILLCNVCRICGLCAQGALRYMMTWAYAHDMLW